MKSPILVVCFLIIGLKATAQILPPYLPSFGLLAWYPFNGNAHDESGNGNHATPVAVISSPDRMGHPNASYHFDGIESNVTSLDSFFHLNMPNYTISCWSSSDTLNNYHNYNNNQTIVNSCPHHGFAIAYNWGHSYKYSVLEASGPSSPVWDILPGAWYTVSADSVNVRVWDHLVFMKLNDTGYRFYINGVLDTHFHSSVLPLNRYCKISMGRTDTAILPAETFWGNLDDFGFWTTALSDSEIVNLYFAITGDTIVCTGASGTLSTFVTGGLWACGSSGIVTINPSSGHFTGISPGTAIITYSIGGLTAHFPVTVTPGPGIDSVVSTRMVCTGDSFSVSGSVPGGIWSVSNPDVSLSAGGNAVAVSSGIDTVFYSYATGCGMTHELNIVTVNPIPIVDPIMGAASVCYPLEMPIFFTDSTPGGTWSHSNVFDSLSSSGALTVRVTGTDTIVYTVTGPCGFAVSTHVLYILTSPVLSAIAGPAYVCVGYSATLSELFTGGIWEISNTAASINSSGEIIGLTPGLDTVTYLATNICGTSYEEKPIIIYSAFECDSVLSSPQIESILPNIKTYPNPVKSIFIISQVCKDWDVQIYNTLGQLLQSRKCQSEQEFFEIGSLPAGIYTVFVSIPNGQTIHQRFLKE